MTTTATTLVNRLGMTFTNALFEQAYDPNGKLSSDLEKAPKFFTTITQYQALVSSSTSTDTYYKNPLMPVINSLTNISTVIYGIISTADDGFGNNYLLPLVPTLTDDYNSLITDLTEDDNNLNGTPKAYNTFIGHTNRLSRLKTSNKKNRPDFNSASLTRQIQTLIYQYESTSTSVVGPVGLGHTTSLFVSPQLVAYRRQLQTSLSTINSSIGYPASSTLTSAVNSASTAITELVLYLVQSRTRDEEFYQNATQIVKDASNMSQLTAGTTYNTTAAYESQTYIVRTLMQTTATSNLY
jgi:hypothetical protein